MPIKRRKDKHRDMTLTLDQRWHLELGGSQGSGFDTEADMRAAWEWHRGAMIERYREQHSGTRPSAWWWYEADVDQPSHDDEADALFTMGQMDADEIARVRQNHLHLPQAMWPRFMTAGRDQVE